MDVFISYRRGEVDRPNAGRIHDYLKTLGFQVYYDKSEKASPTGAQFPDTIARSLEQCKVVIAIIGRNWIDSADRLTDSKDWVRTELLSARPGTARSLIPIYLGATPAMLAGKLPEALGFLQTANSQLLWEGFEEAEKAALLEILRSQVPDVRIAAEGSDCARLELLCDRVRAEDGFDHALLRRAQRNRPGCWLLFGNPDQGQAAIFERIEAFTLPKGPYQQLYSSRKLISLDLHEFQGCDLDEMRTQVIKCVAGALREVEVPTCAALYEMLARKKVALAVLYSVVHISSVKEAQWWLDRLDAIHSELVLLTENGPQIVLALSISYSERKPGLLSFLQKKDEITRFFQSRFPQQFLSDEEAARARTTPGNLIASRLVSAKKADVRNWYDNRYVKPRVENVSRGAFLEQFTQAEELPMDDVLENLRHVMKARAG